MQRCRWYGVARVFMLTLTLTVIEPRNSSADEIWVVPTYQQDTGGGGTAANALWPVTKAGAVRLAWAVPNDLDTFDSAKIAIIPQAPGGASTLNVFVCPAQNGELVYGACAPNTATDHFVGLRFSYSPK